MKRDLLTRIGLVIVIVLLMGNIVLMLERPSRAARVVQHRVVPVKVDVFQLAQFESFLNQQGAQGWELVTLEPNFGFCVFKR